VSLGTRFRVQKSNVLCSVKSLSSISIISALLTLLYYYYYYYYSSFSSIPDWLGANQLSIDRYQQELDYLLRLSLGTCAVVLLTQSFEHTSSVTIALVLIPRGGGGVNYFEQSVIFADCSSY